MQLTVLNARKLAMKSNNKFEEGKSTLKTCIIHAKKKKMTYKYIYIIKFDFNIFKFTAKKYCALGRLVTVKFKISFMKC